MLEGEGEKGDILHFRMPHHGQGKGGRLSLFGYPRGLCSAMK
jgi:hypothetical protein